MPNQQSWPSPSFRPRSPPRSPPAKGGDIFVQLGNRFLATTRTDSEGRFTVYIPPDPTEEIRIRGSLRHKDGASLYAPYVKIDPNVDEARLQLQKRN